jgi:hypothetical protein
LITNKGRNILAKYLIGQAPAYASYLALGVGRRPLSPTDPEEDYSLQQEMEFEVLRVPISSRGYVYDESGKANIVFVGELPSEQRYEFTEIGVFSAKSNTIAGSLGSRMLYTFSESENWEYHDQTAAVGITTFLEPLYLDEDQNIIAVTDPVFRTSSNNALFAGSDVRIETQQRPRFLDKALLIRGDISTLVTGDNGLELEPNTELDYNSTHIHLSGSTPNLNRNPPQDELRLAFAVVSKLDTQIKEVDSVKILIEFASTDATSPDNFARMEVDFSSEDMDIESNRYFIAKAKLESLAKSAGFTWSNVSVVKIYVSVYEKGENTGDPSALSNNFYVALDGLRFENLTSISPLYGLSGYSTVRNEERLPIVKETNSSNLLEFRFGLDVQ